MTNKNWCVWSCANGREDELYASGLSEADAELVATECLNTSKIHRTVAFGVVSLNLKVGQLCL